MRNALTRDRLVDLMKELARTAPRKRHYNVYITGGGTAVFLGWRQSSLDVDLSSDGDEIFHDIQAVKERLALNIEFAQPNDFVPLLDGSHDRHLLIETIGNVAFYHFDPYTQVLSKIVRGFQRDLSDAREFIRSGLVDPETLQSLVDKLPATAYAQYPTLSRTAVQKAVAEFIAQVD
jgi:hypothetical protein